MSIFEKARKILVVEDEQDVAEGLEARLSLEGFQVIMAANGKEGVEKARSEKPDLIIMDMMMPKISGTEACKIIRQDAGTRNIPIIFLTALQKIESVEDAFGVGANAYLSKPYNNDRLLEKIYHFLPKKK